VLYVNGFLACCLILIKLSLIGNVENDDNPEEIRVCTPRVCVT